MKTKLLLISFFLLSFAAAFGQEQSVLNPELYGFGEWNADSLGNHRVVLAVEQKAEMVFAHIPWRRRDHCPEKKGVLIVDAQTGKLVSNVLPVTINREFGELIFQAESGSGTYYVYYLKHYTDGRRNYPRISYPGSLLNADPAWKRKAEQQIALPGKLPQAKLVQFQAIDPFNSFYPMEIIATGEEGAHLLAQYPDKSYLLFPECRENSIRMTADLPLKWIGQGPSNQFSDQVLKGEYFTFQVGLFAARQSIDKLEIEFSGLKKNGQMRIAADAFTCFNTGGTDWEGKPFSKDCPVSQGKVQALWMGVQIPQDIEAGEYTGTVYVKPSNAPAQEVEIRLQLGEETLLASGDDEPGRLSRLRWLNSTIASDDDIVAPYTPLELNGKTVKCLGREVQFGETGFPVSIQSFYSESVTRIQEKGKEVLAAPVNLIVQTQGKPAEWKNRSFELVKHEKGAIAWQISNEIPGMVMDAKVQLEFDGNIDYQLVLTATRDMKIKDIRLEIPMQPEATRYMMGLGEKGGFRAERINWKWAVEKNQDGPWIGDINAGLQARFRDNNYSRPLNTNFYLQKPLYMPDSWYNTGKGGITIGSAKDKSVKITSYSGERIVKKGEQLHYYFNLLITPFRPVDTNKHWHNRYYHSYQPVDTVLAYGANTINVHHANNINPFINYPFFRPGMMKAYIDEAHSKGLKVKIYYTVREITNKIPELFMLRSLDEEILSHGNGGGFSWLQEHLDSNYIAAWFVPELKDAAVINRGISRWHNFYIEGLHWLVKNIGIDGLYIDDLAFDRTSMKRIRKVLERGNPGALIDLHSANQFNTRDGFANSANLYLENLPYIDRLWFGEYFNYDFPPDFWLIETSGIPFGMMGEMLQDGGNPWRGMVFGMTSRAPWSGNPTPIWKVWDDFGIENSEMIGYWDSACPVSTNNEKVKATAYVKDKQVLIALGNWEPTDVEIRLNIDWEKLRLKKETASLIAPAIEKFQPAAEYDFNQTIRIPGGKGYLLILK